MKKSIIWMLAALSMICGCKKNPQNGDTTPLSVNITVTPEKVNAGDAVSLQAVIESGGTTPFTYQWIIDETIQEKTTEAIVYTFKTNGTYIVTLNVTDAKGQTAQKKKAIVVDAAKINEKGTLTVNWVGKMMGYNSKSAAAVANDGSVYTTCRDNKLYKWSSTGESVWIKEVSDATSYGTPSVDTDGTVFIGAGTSNGKGVLKAFNPDGSVKWNFTQWYRSDGTTPEPACLGTIAGISGNNIYFGCTGQTGIVLSANKATGARNGFSAPTGGARSGIAISKDGMILFFTGSYGVAGIEKNLLDGGGSDPVNRKFLKFWNKDTDGPLTPYEGQIALVTIDGAPCVAGMFTDKNGTKVYAVKAGDGTVISTTYIDDTATQDQGGVVVDASGNIICSLNYSLGQDNGGIAIVNPSSSTVVARYRTQEKVSGSPAVDKAGNIHFGTESGFYYIVKQNGANCDLLVKRNVADLILADDRYKDSFSQLGTAKIWCSPVIGDDGKMYICFTDNDTRAFGGVICLSYEGCSGPGNTEWPMIGHDRRHTGKQN